MRKFYDDDEQRRFFEETWSRRRTDFKEVDNAFIMLEAFQNEAGGRFAGVARPRTQLLRAGIG